MTEQTNWWEIPEETNEKEADGFRIEAAWQMGFEPTDDIENHSASTEAVVDFCKLAEEAGYRKGLKAAAREAASRDRLEALIIESAQRSDVLVAKWHGK